jgi:hypothetical protein
MLPSGRSHSYHLLAALAALLAGCAHPLQKYVPHAVGPRAELVMRGQVLPGEAYGVYLFKDALNCTGLQQVGIGVPRRDPETTSIAPGLNTAEVLLTKPNKSVCRVRFSFEPIAGRKYLISTSSTPTGCAAKILDVTDPHSIVREQSLRRRDVGSRLCVPVSQTMTVADAQSRSQEASEAELPIARPEPPRGTDSRPGVTEDGLKDLKGK